MAEGTIDDLLDCSICLDQYKDPKMLPCQHIFCLKCLQQVPFEAGGGYVIKCPICREVATIPNGNFSQIPTAFIINKLMEGMPKTMKRQDMPTSAITCPNHSDKQLDMYCNHCDTLICQRCLTRQHRGHEADFAEEIYDNYMLPLHQMMADTKTQAAGIDREIQELVKAKQASIKACQKAKEQVDEAAKIMHEQVEEERHRLFQEIDQIEKKKVIAISRKQRSAEKVKKALKDTNDSVKEHSESVSKPAVMGSRDNLIKHMKSITTKAMKQMVEVKCENLEISFTFNEPANFKLGEINTNLPPPAPIRRQSLRKKPIDLKVLEAPEWRKLIEKVGISNEELKDESIARLIINYVESHGGIKEANRH